MRVQQTYPQRLMCCGYNLVVLDVVVLKTLLGTAPPAFTLNTHECSEVLWVQFSSIGDGGAKTLQPNVLAPQTFKCGHVFRSFEGVT